ncbi:hypothetical protein GCM10010112_20860 [Actinoplanes lobatus]|uniref:Uncharacterized protein n=1 Tax=Actinoplanes lobatus TaxID=113568 RepID=A0A7W7HPJ7_9ACTN|nr:hypothetical protein [Actinoplanes lobatus]MBB4754341.1 hypothetical protein [Actinoplanes lobatus]GGN62550.1 hypothetical protein GCM10010112_20860 [Actinoplanes lobatus]GIE45099.1 hypothetical protein Alo02nite_79970 [Actinoplanes lobatus]
MDRRDGVGAAIGLGVFGGCAVVVVVLLMKVIGNAGPAEPVAEAAAPTQSVPPGVSVTTTRSAAPSGPFEGTPAESYPKGAGGITLPAAKAVTGFSAAEVKAALNDVRDAMIAGRLDHRMIVDHDPATFLDMLAPNAADHWRKQFQQGRSASVATWIDPAVRLDGKEQPRVSGRVTYSSEKIDGLRTLRITTNFIWVYAFEGGGDTPIAAAHDEIRWEFPRTENLRKADKGMWIGETQSYMAWMDCAASEKGLLRPGTATSAPTPATSEEPGAILRADHPLDITGTC